MTVDDFPDPVDGSSAGQPDSTRPPIEPELGLRWRFLALLTVSSAAIAWPLFQTIGGDATYFVVHGTGRLGIIAFTLAVLLIPPTLVWLMGAALQRSLSAIWAIGIGLFAALVISPSARSMFPSSDVLTIAFTLLSAVCCGVLYQRHRWLRQGLAFLSPVAIVFAGWFLGASQVSGLFENQADAVVNAERSSGTPIVWITFDEFNLGTLIGADFQIDPERLPNFARLASTSTWYRNATTSHPQTHKSIPSMLSGIYYGGEIPIPANWPNNAFSVLSGTYDTVAWEFASRLCTGECNAEASAVSSGGGFASLVKDTFIVYGHNVLPEGMKADLPKIDDRWAGFGDPTADRSDTSSTATETTATETGSTETGAASTSVPHNAGSAQGEVSTDPVAPGARPNDESITFDDIAADIRTGSQARVEAWRAFVERLNADLHSQFLFFHGLIPHEPLDFLPSGQQYNKTITMPAVNGGGTWLDDQYLADNQIQRDLLQVGYVDTMLGQMIDALESSEQWDDALVVVVADHGVSFEAGMPRRAPRPETFDDIARVPLFIKYPGQTTAAIDDSNVETVDIFPTVLDVAEVDATELTLDGVSLLQAREQRPDKRIWPYAKGGQPYVTPEVELPDVLPFWTQAYELYGEDDGALNPYAEGKYRALVGTSVDQLTQGAASSGSITLRRPELYRSIDLDADIIPAFVSADVSGLNDGTAVAVQFGETVVAMGQVFSDKDGDQHIGIMVSPAYLVEAEQGVSFSVIDGERDNPIAHAVS
ncbi:MAG: sulfatase-like hydrolase/transferase [Acidimicrobiia bacterium]|nr:sulfatase-like hydrolase/transferase [Acidimicrobiia bacterium]